MDVNCDYLVYGHPSRDSDGAKGTHPCPHCTAGGALDRVEVYEDEEYATPEIPYGEASDGRMVPYLVTFEEEDLGADGPRSAEETTTLHYARGDRVVALRGPIYLRDVSPYGAWLSDTGECLRSIRRLKRAGLACMNLPELNRMVLEQKNDDGLLRLMRTWLDRAQNADVGIETFGPFYCDAALAPVLHAILRSEWVEKRKRRCCSNCELKPGWAQGFYDWRRVAVIRRTPGARGDPEPPAGSECRRRSAARAALEASRERDWLVRNEAVIQLCWALYCIRCAREGERSERLGDGRRRSWSHGELQWDHSAESLSDDPLGRSGSTETIYVEESESDDGEDGEPAAGEARERILEGWARSIVSHRVALQTHERRDPAETTAVDAERLAVMYAVDHLPGAAERSPTLSRGSDGLGRGDFAPGPELTEFIASNERFSSPRGETAAAPEAEDMRVPAVGEVTAGVPDRMEVRNRDPEATAKAIASSLPRVSPLAVSGLTLRAPDPGALRSDPRVFWPVFVNPTRACYRLFKSVASAGPAERELTLRLLRRGVLPCFACRGESVVDRMTSSTLALSFAACGLRLFAPEAEAPDSAGSAPPPPRAGLLYFAARYVLVRWRFARWARRARAGSWSRGTDATDCCACPEAGRSARAVGPERRTVTYRGGYPRRDTRPDAARALLIVFEGLLDARTAVASCPAVRPGAHAQLPYLRALGKMPDSAGSASRGSRRWLETLRGGSPFTGRARRGRRAAFRSRGRRRPRAAQQRERSPVQGGLQTAGRPHPVTTIADSTRGSIASLIATARSSDPHELMKPEPGARTSRW
ncbi:hypothetical protein Q5P01_000843 [Channa striata]|uniref:Uncharacterized protein n=1 Tax=Channa striata TaxID=64152 RepID=A0AA88LFL3_CHASR|nr:hypothetical protein Q5P01_000843 [Channa striata]